MAQFSHMSIRLVSFTLQLKISCASPEESLCLQPHFEKETGREVRGLSVPVTFVLQGGRGIWTPNASFWA